MMREFPKRAIHLDFHTMPDVPDVGRDFSAEDFARTLQQAGVDYITVFARCNLGFAYYPTRVGIVHPSLKRDMLGEMIEACHRYGIKAAAYINAGIDHEHALRHRDWVKVNKEGQVYRYQQMGHFFRNMCLNTGYGAHLRSMVEEVLTSYPVDGLFLDCFSLAPCYGVECLDAMKARRMDIMSDAEVQRFASDMTYEYCRGITALVEKIRPGIFIVYNGLPYRFQPTHCEIEVLPTGGWGYDYLPLAIRFARTLGKPLFTMTGRFHKGWGDFGGIRTRHSLLFDCYTSIANAGTCSIGDHMHPRGRLDPAVYDLIGQVYADIRRLDPWVDGATAVADIAVVDPEIADFPLARRPGVQGAVRLLAELKYQFDVSDGSTDLFRYKVVVLPDQVAVTAELQVALKRHLDNGGFVLSSANAGLDREQRGFAIPDYAVTYEGPEPHHYSFMTVEEAVSRDIPRMPVAIYSPGIAMKARAGAEVLAHLIKPYFNYKSWDYYHENLYIPPDEDTGRPALVRCGHVYHFSFPVFSGYFEHAAPAYKYLVRNCLEQVLAQPVVKVENMPTFGGVTVTQAGRRRMAHLLAYVPELRGKAQVIEEAVTVSDVGIGLRRDGMDISRVYLAPSQEDLPFNCDEDYVWVTVPQVSGYQLVVFE
jgi:hypothetical protein